MCVAAPHVMDTPEVIAEKNRHFQLYNAAAKAAAAAPDPQQAHYRPHVTAHHVPVHHVQPAVHHVQPAVHHVQPTWNAAPQRWTGPMAATVPAGLPGSGPVVPQTADVSAARNAFFQAYKAQLAATGAQTPVVAHHVPAVHHTGHHVPQAVTYQQKWTGPMAATVPAGLPGAGAVVAQTADVAAATQAFHAAYQQAVARTLG